MPTNNWRRSCVKKRPDYSVILLLSIAGCCIIALCSLLFGAAALTPGQVLRALLDGPGSGATGTIVRYARLPRTAAALLTGCALGVSGCVIQGVLGNSLASPGIIGVNAGAGLAVTCLCAAGAVSGWIIAAVLRAIFGWISK